MREFKKATNSASDMSVVFCKRTISTNELDIYVFL